MSVSMDDKLLGEKSHYYCSSSESEPEEDDDKAGEEGPKTSSMDRPPITSYKGTCVNTGPKGVIQDWREFKRLESEKRETQEREKQQLVKKLAMTCSSYLNDKENETTDPNDDFLEQYRKARLEEMKKLLHNTPEFGKVITLSADDFVTAVDGEKSQVTIIIHIYEERSIACEAMNGCLVCLAQEYPAVKFCKIRASDARLSGHFASYGVPALLVYRNKELIGNFIRISDELGDDFFATDVECFLVEHGMLPSNASHGVVDKTTGELRSTLPDDEGSGSDFDID